MTSIEPEEASSLFPTIIELTWCLYREHHPTLPVVRSLLKIERKPNQKESQTQRLSLRHSGAYFTLITKSQQHGVSKQVASFIQRDSESDRKKSEKDAYFNKGQHGYTWKKEFFRTDTKNVWTQPQLSIWMKRETLRDINQTRIRDTKKFILMRKRVWCHEMLICCYTTVLFVSNFFDLSSNAFDISQFLCFSVRRLTLVVLDSLFKIAEILQKLSISCSDLKSQTQGGKSGFLIFFDFQIQWIFLDFSGFFWIFLDFFGFFRIILLSDSSFSAAEKLCLTEGNREYSFPLILSKSFL